MTDSSWKKHTFDIVCVQNNKDTSNVRIKKKWQNVDVFLFSEDREPITNLPLPCILQLTPCGEEEGGGGASIYIFVHGEDPDDGNLIASCVDHTGIEMQTINVDRESDAFVIEYFVKNDDGSFIATPLDASVPVRLVSAAAKLKTDVADNVLFPIFQNNAIGLAKGANVSKKLFSSYLDKIRLFIAQFAEESLTGSSSSSQTISGNKRKTSEPSSSLPSSSATAITKPEACEESSEDESDGESDGEQVGQEEIEEEKSEECKEKSEECGEECKEKSEERGECKEKCQETSEGTAVALVAAVETTKQAEHVAKKSRVDDAFMTEFRRSFDKFTSDCEERFLDKSSDVLATFAEKQQLFFDQCLEHWEHYKKQSDNYVNGFAKQCEIMDDQNCHISLLLDTIKEKSALMDAVLARAGAQPRPFVQWVRTGLKHALQKERFHVRDVEFVAINMQARIHDELEEFALRLPHQMLYYLNEMDRVSSMEASGWAVPFQQLLYDALVQAGFNNGDMTRVMDVGLKMKASVPGLMEMLNVYIRLPMPVSRPQDRACMIEDTFAHMPFGAILRDALERAKINEVSDVTMLGFDALVSFHDHSPPKKIVIALPTDILRLMWTTTPVKPGNF